MVEKKGAPGADRTHDPGIRNPASRGDSPCFCGFLRLSALTCGAGIRRNRNPSHRSGSQLWGKLWGSTAALALPGCGHGPDALAVVAAVLAPAWVLAAWRAAR